jgi:hypothetical protein
MKSIALFLTVMATFVLCSSSQAGQASQAKTIKVFLLAGQSNAGGAGNGDGLPADLKKTDKEVLLFSKGHKNELALLAPYNRVAEKFQIEHTAFGPELVFGKEMKKAFPNDVILIVKQSTGGTSIVAWDKDWKRADWKSDLKLAKNESKTPYYGVVLSMMKEGVTQAKAKFPGARVEYCGMLWVQSERDDEDVKLAKDYEKNLRALIQNIRTDVGVPNLPFLFAGPNVRRWGDIILNGMKKITQEVPNTALIPVNDLPKHEGIHYNTEGQMKLGKRFADAYLEIVKKAGK